MHQSQFLRLLILVKEIPRESFASLSVLLLVLFKRDQHFIYLRGHQKKSTRLVNSTRAAEILCAGEALDKIVHLRDALVTVHGVELLLAALLDSKDLYSSLSFLQNVTDKSV